MEGREIIQFVPDVKQRKRRNPGQVAGVHKYVQGVVHSQGKCRPYIGNNPLIKFFLNKLCNGNIENNDVHILLSKYGKFESSISRTVL